MTVENNGIGPQRGQGEDPALARKRRIELRSKSRGSDDDDDSEYCDDEEHPPSKRRCSTSKQDSDSSCDGSEEAEADLIASGKPSIRGIKKQARYEPGVPMSKEELARWRKEARRVRNRYVSATLQSRSRFR